ncbi:substrate-binding periplasmic protein [Fusibacter ferrireducens]|uniref:Transporter substrate-binding domain-containing protein n=1 Tax=Fusibacter ferrireducens TaxID=2785058 RepID=A0ABR9ZYI4_9FIRM|nr:transporter substrate-binding domain-containing protein [Fusibacter ferrireducens]MBF4694639.1 transporter substrate-binding domain-containing protein [Fusibacter ferrireducens]
MKHKKQLVQWPNMLIIISLMAVFMGLWMNRPEAVLNTVVPVKTTKYNADKTYFEPNLDRYIIATGEYEPYIYTENGVNKGFEYEMLIEIFKEMEIDYEIRTMSWVRGLYNLNTGDAFAVFPYAKTSEREQSCIFTDSLIDVEDRKVYFYYYQKEERPFVLQSIEDLKRHRLGGISGYYYTEIYDELGLEYDQSNDKIECFTKLKEGRIDTVALNPVVAEALINRYFPEDKAAFKKSDFSFTVPPSGDRLMINREDPRAEAFVEQFNQAFHKLKDSGMWDSHDEEK